MKNNRGSLKDLLFSFGRISVISGVFSFALVSFVIDPILKNIDGQYASSSAILAIGNQSIEGKMVELPYIDPRMSLNKETPDLAVVSGNSIISCGSPHTTVNSQVMASFSGDDNINLPKRERIIEYIVRDGDDISSLAEKFQVSIDTILWANNLTKSARLKIGQSLIILPTTGVLYFVNGKDSVAIIARQFKADPQKIIEYNQLPEDGDIGAGDILIIPDGIMPPKTVIKQPSSTSLPNSYFLYPAPSSFVRTQKLHWYNAVDLANGSCGSPIYAAASGSVQRSGYNRTSGNFVRIIHGNGVVTYYGHMSTIIVSPNQAVSRGQIIGYVGNTGYTIGATGCHLHFGVYGAKNPFAY
ncbi:MAG: peptidoglycan DD-metalloendopeptidase family protein [bacterium]